MGGIRCNSRAFAVSTVLCLLLGVRALDHHSPNAALRARSVPSSKSSAAIAANNSSANDVPLHAADSRPLWSVRRLIPPGSTKLDIDHDVAHLIKHGHTLLEDVLDMGHAALARANISAPDQINTNPDAPRIWEAYGRVIKTFTDSVIRQSLPMLVEATATTNVSVDCLGSLLQLMTGLRALDAWAVRMIDSSGRPMPPGLIDGTITDLGSYDECLAIEGPTDIRGKYCLAKWSLSLPPRPQHLTLQSRVFNFTGSAIAGTFLDDLGKFAHAFYDRFGRIGICMPSSCSKEDLQQVIDSSIKGSHFYLSVSYCEVESEGHVFSNLQITIVVLFAIAFVIVFLATGAELITKVYYPELGLQFVEGKPNRKKFLDALICLSFYSNGIALLDTSHVEGSVDAIHGLRVISMYWIVLTHTYLIPMKETFAFARNFLLIVEGTVFQLIINGWVLVDTFFCVGAALATQSALKSAHRKKGAINLMQVAANRFFRLTPSLWLTVGLIFLLPALGSGPLWREYFDGQVQRCNETWWATMFYFNNWFPENRLCMLHTWYLAADMQLFLAASLLVILFYKWPRFALAFVGALTGGAMLFNGLLTYVKDYSPTVMYNTPSEREVKMEATTVYTPTYVHLGPYLIGVLLGYVLFKNANRKVSIRPAINCAIWTFMMGVGMSILMSTRSWNRGVPWTPLEAGMYAGLHRTAWAVVIAWVTFACATGNGGFVNTFLSWKLFVPLSRLSFTVYLMHFLVLWIRYASIRWTLPFSHYTMFCEFIVNLVMSTGVSVVAYLLVEAPAGRLYKLWGTDAFEWATIVLKKNEETAESRQAKKTKRQKQQFVEALSNVVRTERVDSHATLPYLTSVTHF